jgi:transposase
LLGVSGPRRNSEKTKDVLAGHPLGENEDRDVSLPAGTLADPAAAPAPAPAPPPASGAEAETAQTAGPGVGAGTEEEKKSKPPKGHGRLSWKEYPDAECIPILHEALRPGDTCPLCGKGKLYDTQRPSPILRIMGQAPLVAKCWLCEVLRCNTCGHLFTAAAPEEAKGPKYDPTAASMIMLERYGTGLPHYRQARLQQDLHTPVPAATQWDVVRQAAKELQAVFAELRRLAAQAHILYSDDSYVRILAFMGKRLARLLDENALSHPDRTGLFTTAITAVTMVNEGEERRITIFVTGRKHAGENLDDLLQLRDKTLDPPLLMTDALNRNVPKTHEVIEANCMAHYLESRVIRRNRSWPVGARVGPLQISTE